jgi:hypothetical protein
VQARHPEDVLTDVVVNNQRIDQRLPRGAEREPKRDGHGQG